jgi:serine/threonine-protein kinase HipA
LRIISEGDEPSVGRGSYEEVSIEALCARLNARPSMPLAEFAADLRMSLAGAQDKLPILYRDGHFLLPRDGAASSHILKPANARFPDSVVNETFSTELAKRLGFIVSGVRIIQSDPAFVLIERYDRKFLSDGTVERLHQEDFCQALGIAHQKKYESDGGPGFTKCAAVLEKTASPGLNRLRLARWGIFNALIGNADAHGKNLSLLYGESRIPNMAPIYDLLSTAVYPELSTKMAMHIGGERLLDRIYGSQWERYSKDVNLSARRIFLEIETMTDQIVGQAEHVADEMKREYGSSEFYPKALSVIAKNCAKVKSADRSRSRS